MKEQVLKDKTMRFAIRIVNLYKFLIENKKEFVLSKQLLKSGTSIGANCREGDFAQSKTDFIHKLSIAQKECSETLYWLELIYSTEYIKEIEYKSIYTDAEEIMKLLTASIKTAKANLKLTTNH